jgi:hypothetical protein
MLLTVERTIGVDGRILTGLSALKTQKAGRQNGGDFGQAVSKILNGHAPMNGCRFKRVYNFT